MAQRGIVTALRNQIAAGRVGHAYLFTGTRGTGKTTCAKIFAKAVNCLHPQRRRPLRRVRDLPRHRRRQRSGRGGDRRGLQQRRGQYPRSARRDGLHPQRLHITRYISSTRCTCSPQRRFNALLKITGGAARPCHLHPGDDRDPEGARPPSCPAASGMTSPASGRRISPSRVEYIAGQEELELTTERRGADRPAGRWCHARCAVHSGHLRRRDGQSGRRCGPPDGGRHRPELPVPHLGRHCGAGRAPPRWLSWLNCGSSRWM